MSPVCENLLINLASSEEEEYSACLTRKQDSVKQLATFILEVVSTELVKRKIEAFVRTPLV